MIRVLPVALGALTTVAVWSVGARGRRRPHRLPPAVTGAPAAESPVRGDGDADGGHTRSPRAPRAMVLAIPAAARGVGRVVRRFARRPPDPAADERVGWVLAAAGALLVVSPVASVLTAAAVAVWPFVQRRRGARTRARVVVDELPDVIDLLRIAVDGGLTVHDALVAVVGHGHGVMIDALAAVLVRVRQGERLGDALPAAGAISPAAQGFVDTLVAAERYGASAGRELDRAATEARVARRRRGEEAARRVPVKMLFPLVLCTLPALGLLTVLPLLARSLPSLAH